MEGARFLPPTPPLMDCETKNTHSLRPILLFVFVTFRFHFTLLSLRHTTGAWDVRQPAWRLTSHSCIPAASAGARAAECRAGCGAIWHSARTSTSPLLARSNKPECKNQKATASPIWYFSGGHFATIKSINKLATKFFCCFLATMF